MKAWIVQPFVVIERVSILGRGPALANDCLQVWWRKEDVVRYTFSIPSFSTTYPCNAGTRDRCEDVNLPVKEANIYSLS